MGIPPSLNMFRDLGSSYVNSQKAEQAPAGSPKKFGAQVSMMLGATGAMTTMLGLPTPARIFPVSPHALTAVATMKNSAGVFPAMISTIDAYKSGDRTATTLGAANFLCATGFFRVAEEMAKKQAANLTNPAMKTAVANLPAYAKFGIGVATLAYSFSQLDKTTKLE